MPTSLQSPGVSVSVINESFYSPAAPGTVPLIFVASASNKTNPSGSTAAGTVPANAGKVYTITSQRDLVDTFGVPTFYTDVNNNPIHGSELNEYGLQAAYSFLGVSSQAYVVRADVDLASLEPQASEPTGAPADGTYWVDTKTSLFGVFEWDKVTGSFTNKVPLVVDETNRAVDSDSNDGVTPAAAFGKVGQYAMVVTSVNQCALWYKNSDAVWVRVGSMGENEFISNSAQPTFLSTVWATSWPAVVGTAKPTAINSTGTLVLNGLSVSVGTGLVEDVATAINANVQTSGIGAKVVNGSLAIYADAVATSNGVDADGSIEIGAGSTSALLVELGLSVGTYAGPTVFIGSHTQYPNFGSKPSGSIYVKTTTPNVGARWVVKKYSATTDSFDQANAPIYGSGAAATYALDKAGGGVNIPVGTLFVESNYDHGDNYFSTTISELRPVLASFKLKVRSAVSPTVITCPVPAIAPSVSPSTLTVKVTSPGSASFSTGVDVAVSGGLSDLVQALNNSGVPNLTAKLNVDGSASIIHETGGEIKFIDPSDVLFQMGFVAGTTANLYALGQYEPDMANYIASNWMPLTFTAEDVVPSSDPVDGQLWYSPVVDEIDLLVNDGDQWMGYGNMYPGTDPNGPIVAYSAPTEQSNGDPLVNGDVWVSTADIDRYGKDVYVWNGSSLKWELQDTADSTSPKGWVFHDARWATTGEATLASTIAELRTSDYVDPDAPDPALYPRGVVLWNLRRSSFNVKKYVKNYIDVNENLGYNPRVPSDPMANYNRDRWISVSPNNADGTGAFGRFAQRNFVVAGFKSLVDENQEIRDTDTLVFNLIACPGYPEAIQNMIAFNTDRRQTAFVIGDTPFRLEANGTALQAWGLNSNGALDNNDTGAVSYSEYMAMFYPSGYANDLAGNYIVVPPSHMMLRTIALSDQQSYPWFAPAGLRRGVVDNATSVGYLKDGEFTRAPLPESLRDVLYNVKINPIATLTGAGIVNFGQKTRANVASALDRINVARLVCYVRRQLDLIVRPYLFEPNDKITQNEVKNVITSFFLELIGNRAIYDFIVVCDSSNNTPARIDRNELWVDVAIEPVKAIEFIYIPIRLVNTGAIKSGTFSLA